MKNAFPREGILAALALPFDADGQITQDALRQHLEWLRARGIHGVLALGSTASFPLLTLDQRKQALETVARLAEPLPVIANISDIRPAVVAELGRFARELGLPGVGIMPPWFYPAGAADQLAHFLHAAEASDLPVMLYNFPERTGNRIDLETVAAFADRAPMAGIKQSGGEFTYHKDLIELGREKGYVVFSGSDTRLPEVFELGAVGCIGGLVNFVPELMVEQFNVHVKGAPGKLEPTASRMNEVGSIINRLTFPENVGVGMRVRGFDPGQAQRLISPDTLENGERVAAELRRLFADWDLAPVTVQS